MSAPGGGDLNGGTPSASDIESATQGALPRSIGIADAVITKIDDDHRHQPTRCEGLDVEAVVAHLVNGLAWFAAAGVGRLYDPTTRPEPDLADRPLHEAFEAAADAVRLAWSTEGPFRATYAMPSGPTTGWSLAGYICLEQVGHALDLADAVDGLILVPDDLAHSLLAIGAALGDEVLRAPGMFGAELAVPDGANATGRVRAFLGRAPRDARPHSPVA